MVVFLWASWVRDVGLQHGLAELVAPFPRPVRLPVLAPALWFRVLGFKLIGVSDFGFQIGVRAVGAG